MTYTCACDRPTDAILCDACRLERDARCFADELSASGELPEAVCVLRRSSRGDHKTALLVGYFSGTPEEAVRAVKRTRVYRRFKHVPITPLHLDGTACSG